MHWLEQSGAQPDKIHVCYLMAYTCRTRMLVGSYGTQSVFIEILAECKIYQHKMLEAECICLYLSACFRNKTGIMN